MKDVQLDMRDERGLRWGRFYDNSKTRKYLRVIFRVEVKRARPSIDQTPRSKQHPRVEAPSRGERGVGVASRGGVDAILAYSCQEFISIHSSASICNRVYTIFPNTIVTPPPPPPTKNTDVIVTSSPLKKFFVPYDLCDLCRMILSSERIGVGRLQYWRRIAPQVSKRADAHTRTAAATPPSVVWVSVSPLSSQAPANLWNSYFARGQP